DHHCALGFFGLLLLRFFLGFLVRSFGIRFGFRLFLGRRFFLARFLLRQGAEDESAEREKSEQSGGTNHGGRISQRRHHFRSSTRICSAKALLDLPADFRFVEFFAD